MTLETVEQIVALLTEYPVSEIALERNGERVCARKPLLSAAPPLAAPEEVAETSAAAESATPEEAPEPVVLTATMVGLFHQARPQVSYGTMIALGQVVGSIESMKVMNDVPATTGGRVVDVFVEEGAPVEYGQALFRLAPA